MEQPQMKPEEALQLLDQATALAPLPRAQHSTVVVALQTVHRALQQLEQLQAKFEEQELGVVRNRATVAAKNGEPRATP